MGVSLFISYAHEDEDTKTRLETHLSPLKRLGLVSVCHDRKIRAGEDFENQISEHLETSDIILLLISADFIASSYCHDIEMKRALERHGAGEARVIPVIVRPCRWQSMPFGRLRATPVDGKPISKYSDLDEALEEVTADIEDAAKHIIDSPGTLASAQIGDSLLRPIQLPRERTRRHKRALTEQDIDHYLDEAFTLVRDYFLASADALDWDNVAVAVEVRDIGPTRFIATAYRAGAAVSRCTVWRSLGDGFGKGICYYSGVSESNSPLNELLQMSQDGKDVKLRPTMRIVGSDEPLPLNEAAELLWSMFLEPLDY